jgi:hypothetical protein
VSLAFFPDSSPPDVPVHCPPLTTYGRSLPINTTTYYTCTSHEAATVTVGLAILGIFRFTLRRIRFPLAFLIGFFIFKHRALPPCSICQDPTSSGNITRLPQQIPVHNGFHLCTIDLSRGTLPPDVQLPLIVPLLSL